MPGQPQSKPVVRIVDDDDSMRLALGRLLEAAGYEVRSYPSAGDFLVAEHEDEAGCVILDLKMPGPSGLELQQALARRDNSLPIVFLTGHGEVETTVQALKAGASDFLTKPVARETLLTAVDRALAADATRRAQRHEIEDLRSRYETLTQRQREVLAHVVAGLLNKQIAAELGAAERTVKAHRSQVMQKMQVDSLAELVRVAARLGLHGRASSKDA